MSKKILIAADHFWPSVGGVEVYLGGLARSLHRAGYVVEVSGRKIIERTSLDYNSIPIHEFGCTGNFKSPAEIEELQRFARFVYSGNFDAIILLQNPILWPLLAVLGLPQPRPKTILFPILNEHMLKSWAPHDLLSKSIDLMRACDVIVSIADIGPIPGVLEAHKLPHTFIPHAVELRSEYKDFRSIFGLDSKKPLISFMANFYPEKNHHEVIKQMLACDGDFQFLLAGRLVEGCEAYYEEAMRLCSQDARIKMIGAVPEEVGEAAIRSSDLVLLGSFGEGSPISILQGMAAGVCWLATPECGSVHRQAGGVIVPVAKFSEAIKKILTTDLGKRLGELGREHWSRCLSWKATLPAIIDMIEKGRTSINLSYPEDLQKRQQDLSLR